MRYNLLTKRQQQNHLKLVQGFSKLTDYSKLDMGCFTAAVDDLGIIGHFRLEKLVSAPEEFIGCKTVMCYLGHAFSLGIEKDYLSNGPRVPWDEYGEYAFGAVSDYAGFGTYSRSAKDLAETRSPQAFIFNSLWPNDPEQIIIRHALFILGKEPAPADYNFNDAFVIEQADLDAVLNAPTSWPSAGPEKSDLIHYG